jgi:hypothetical protein
MDEVHVETSKEIVSLTHCPNEHRRKRLGSFTIAMYFPQFPAEGGAVPTLTLGRRFEPGRDSGHFCQPTSVAVAPGTATAGGDVFVGDGYCNSRVVHFTPSGRFIREIKARDEGEPQLMAGVREGFKRVREGLPPPTATAPLQRRSSD